MRKILFVLMAAFALAAFGQKNPEQISALLNRIGGEGTSSRIETRVKNSLSNEGQDVFEISSRKGKPYIQGSSLSALTAGIGWYLNHYAHVNLSWNQLTTDLSVVTLPVPKEKERRECSADYRYYLNYCTYSYSMAFWTKERWEQEIDWMALHGINLPLALVGTDVVWKNMLTEMGYSRIDVDKFVAGPGFQAWWLMNNLEGWGGPNPDWWYERQEHLCQFILGRMRELGMDPVLPGYSGILPSNATEKMGVKVIDQGYWCSGFRRPSFLLPTDERYAEIAQLYYKHLAQVMGKSKYYSMDPFHEGGRTNGINLKVAFNTIYQEMLKHSPGAVWVMQSWGDNPRQEALDTLENGGLLVLDLYSEGLAKWVEKKGYSGHDFVWCMLHNFGGKTGMHGRFETMLIGYYNALEQYPNGTKGIGAIPEGLETSPILYDLLFELPWMKREEGKDWMQRYTEARYGAKSEAMEKGWDVLAKSVLNCPQPMQDVEAVICARPALNVTRVSGWGTTKIYHDIRKVREAAALMLKEKHRFKDNLNYEYDITDVVRQTLTDSTYYLLKDIATSHKNKDMDAFKKQYAVFLEILSDLNRLLSQVEPFKLETWTQSARNVCNEVQGTTEEDKDWMEWNARTLVSVWGPEQCAERGRLHDYSSRQWGGMLNDFYRARWEMFFKALEEGKNITSPEWFKWEDQWSRSKTITNVSKESPISVAEELFNKYFKQQ
jgi:alpha-N-acetylglucosaminidase